MIVTLKYFHEKTDADFSEYNKLWDENKERFIFIQSNLSLSKQMSYINDSMDNTKDILAIRFPTMNEIQHNKIINNILLGNGIVYENNKIWYPKEVWVYSPQH
jgi:Zn-finger domain-containing protein